jgi:hypothetical protein
MRVHFSASAQDAQLAQTFISRRSNVASPWVAEASYMSWQLHDKAARVCSLIMAYWLGWPTCRPTELESLRRW